MDFTNLPRRGKAYAGANGSKIAVVYNDEIYMLKFPGAAKLNEDMSYANGCVSEYLGSHIFALAGLTAQDTMLGTYRLNGKEKVVVACRDFTASGWVLQDFMSLKNTILNSESNGAGTELSDILDTIQEQSVMDKDVLNEHFWNMFIVDALIGNWDRHNGNWGFLYNTVTDETRLAPVYDCGSCLFPQAGANTMKAVLEDRSEMDLRVFDHPLSAIRENGQKINYFDFISSLKVEGCNEALKRMTLKLDMHEIGEMINAAPYISNLQKEFYIRILTERKEHILDFSLQKLKKRERRQSRSK